MTARNINSSSGVSRQFALFGFPTIIGFLLIVHTVYYKINPPTGSFFIGLDLIGSTLFVSVGVLTIVIYMICIGLFMLVKKEKNRSFPIAVVVGMLILAFIIAIPLTIAFILPQLFTL